MNPRRQFIEVVTIGFPFCAFKILSGMVLVEQLWLTPLGCLLILLGALDFAINLANLGSLATGRPRVLGVCVTQLLARWWRPSRSEWHEVGVSLDVLLSFLLVAVMIGGGLLARLPAWGLHVWSAGVVLNVLGAGFGRLSSSLERATKSPD